MLINELLSKTPGVAVSEHVLAKSSMSRQLTGGAEEKKGTATPQIPGSGDGVNAVAADGDIGPPPDSAVISEHKRLLGELVGSVDMLREKFDDHENRMLFVEHKNGENERILKQTEGTLQ